MARERDGETYFENPIKKMKIEDQKEYYARFPDGVLRKVKILDRDNMLDIYLVESHIHGDEIRIATSREWLEEIIICETHQLHKLIQFTIVV